MAAPAPVLCAGGAGVLLGAFQVWGVSVAEGWCRRVRGRRRAASWADENRSRRTRGVAASWADDRTQEFDPRA